MRTSNYNVYFCHSGKHYVYNTLSTSILSLPEELIYKLKDNVISSIEDTTTNILQDNGIVVDDESDELAMFEYYYNSIQYGKTEEELRLVVLPTYQCNLRCTYCFEQTQDLKIKLDDEKIDSLLLFAKNELSSKTYKSLRLVLFGGEPLLNKNACINLTQRLSDLATMNQCAFISQIITNSILVDEQIINTLIKPYNMKLQITIDGDKSTHDRRRIYKSGKGTFDEIKNNLFLLNKLGCKQLIDLRLNLDRKNLDHAESIITEFSQLCNYLYVGLLRPAGNNSCRNDDCITDAEYLSFIRPRVFEILKHTQNRNEEYISFGKKNPCAMNRHGNYIIDPFLDVYKCDNFVGIQKHKIGKIINGKLHKTSEFYKQATWSPFRFEKCRICKLLPVCCSDCAYRCLLNEGNMNTPHCALDENDLVRQIIIYLDNKK